MSENVLLQWRKMFLYGTKNKFYSEQYSLSGRIAFSCSENLEQVRSLQDRMEYRESDANDR